MVEGVATRIFVAVPLPDEIRMALADRLGSLDMPGKPVPSENWHITLRFLGWTDDVALDRLLAALDEADLGPPFDMKLNEMGAFPRPKSATVIWLAVSGGLTRLEQLAAEAEEAAQRRGLRTGGPAIPGTPHPEPGAAGRGRERSPRFLPRCRSRLAMRVGGGLSLASRAGWGQIRAS